MIEPIYCLIVEDEYPHFQKLEHLIINHSRLAIANSCTRADEIFSILEDQKEKGKAIGLIFLDIQLDDGDEAGMDFIETYRGMADIPPIIVTTAHIKINELAKRAWKMAVPIRGFIQKSELSFAELQRVVEEIYPFEKEQLEESYVEYFSDHLWVKFYNDSKECLIGRIKHDDILYVSTDLRRRTNNRVAKEIERNYIKIYTEQEEYKVLKPLKHFLENENLPESKFIRIHDSYIVNLNRIKYVDFKLDFLYLEHLAGRIPVGGKYRTYLPKEYRLFKEKGKDETDVT